MKSKKSNGKAGRPPLEIDWKEFDQLCFLQCSIVEIATWFHCSHDTIERKVRQQWKVPFSEYFDKKRIGGIISLRRNMFRLAEKNAAVAIFMAKNHLGMVDNQEQKIDITTKGESLNEGKGYVTIPDDRYRDAFIELSKIGIGIIHTN